MDNLSKIPKDNPFKVPDSYFEDFPMRMQERIEKQKVTPVHSRSFFLLKPQFAIGFVALLIIVSVFSISKFAGGGTSTMTTDDIADVINENPYAMDDELIYEYWSENENVANSSKSDTIDQDVQDMIDYLVEENIDDYLLLAEI